MVARGWGRGKTGGGGRLVEGEKPSVLRDPMGGVMTTALHT